ncbi:hypothetical protein [Lysinibacillus fusiformis]|uniref:hypothetical protein n=1 Tax=Lysinibacillus fusiformis TaxID=28031 RepID=UPI0000F38FA7|nr:hypothetical protein [Lysinibacillus fusiformis]EAZ84574.1 hypothetical protein BB14905_21523 [Bacillus sp. B14905]MED4079065.1 hypothetical protein [Lysinibacillus fusiformis]NOG28508.1 hypothetical protein [Lysinibacillus fusiformis]PCD82012.1 hypothetical protein CNQ87_15505 [Lysinibacillus fusiformis]SCX51913.1 hypothetical protein SAMN02787108_01840 [Lysinibacillus fusiformis]
MFKALKELRGMVCGCTVPVKTCNYTIDCGGLFQKNGIYVTRHVDCSTREECYRTVGTKCECD